MILETKAYTLEGFLKILSCFETHSWGLKIQIDAIKGFNLCKLNNDKVITLDQGGHRNTCETSGQPGRVPVYGELHLQHFFSSSEVMEKL